MTITTDTQSLEARLREHARGLALELDAALDDASIDTIDHLFETIQHLSSEACRDLANSRNGMRDLREALRNALHVARARGRGEFLPAQDDCLASSEQVLIGWSE